VGKGLISALLVAVLCSPGTAHALRLSASETSGGTELRAEGHFEKGDAAKVKAAFQRARAASKPVHTVTLHSEGGLVFEALEIGRFLREQKSATRVDNGRICASACVYAFLGGVVREAGPTARFGVHMHSLYASQEYIDRLKRLLLSRDLDLDTKVRFIVLLNEQVSAQQSSRLAAYVLSMGVSVRMLEPTFKTAAIDMHWLSTQELRDFNILNAQ
jgi:hypothetical protein